MADLFPQGQKKKMAPGMIQEPRTSMFLCECGELKHVFYDVSHVVDAPHCVIVVCFSSDHIILKSGPPYFHIISPTPPPTFFALMRS